MITDRILAATEQEVKEVGKGPEEQAYFGLLRDRWLR